MTPLLRVKGITKRFPGVLANDHIDLEIEPGEIHALLGENGAGKTTLMNILYGLYHPQEGEIFFQDKPVTLNSPLEAIHLGIGMVHQHFMLIPVFTVTENVILGIKPAKRGQLDMEQAAKQIEEISQKYGLNVNPKALIWQLSVGMQQRVEILKALYRGARLLILDEPTAVLTPQESEDLFKILKTLAAQGTSIIFISHKLNEVMAVSDRVTVLRGGRVVNTVRTCDTDPCGLASMMVGREVVLRIERPPHSRGDTRLSVKQLRALDDKGLEGLRGISFDLHAGEILGIAGVDGNGQRELAEVLTGTRKAFKGSIYVNDKDLFNKTPADFIRMRVACVPQDRKRSGSIGDFSIGENAILKSQNQAPFARFGFFQWGPVYLYADTLIQKYDVRAPNSKVKAKALSGGNLQKLIFARETSRPHDILIAMQPTRGLDVSAMEFVYRYLLEERSKGTAILLISTELDEILSLSDRIAVIYEGRLVGEVSAETASIEKIGLWMAGVLNSAPCDLKDLDPDHHDDEAGQTIRGGQ